jgi:diguanylate cyclase (GGDEF)-like protein
VTQIPSFPPSINSLLCRFFEISKDGYAIFDSNDMLIYSNYVYRDIFCLEEHANGKEISFADMIKNAYIHKRGIHISTEDIDDWLRYVATVRRSREFRTFEVDLVDGRWMLFSEQVLDSGELLVQCTDFTRQKVLETELKSSVSDLHKLALTDELTQIANRRCFVDSVESELSRCKRNDGFVTMLLLDLDHFKEVNDTFGHPAGDLVLKHVAKVLKNALRQYDILGRIGGEEFAVFLGATDTATAKKIASRILLDLEKSMVKYGKQDIRITTSIGMASRGCKVSFEQLYTEADEALYHAKEQGRNRLALYTEINALA